MSPCRGVHVLRMSVLARRSSMGCSQPCDAKAAKFRVGRCTMSGGLLPAKRTVSCCTNWRRGSNRGSPSRRRSGPRNQPRRLSTRRKRRAPRPANSGNRASFGRRRAASASVRAEAAKARLARRLQPVTRFSCFMAFTPGFFDCCRPRLPLDAGAGLVRHDLDRFRLERDARGSARASQARIDVTHDAGFGISCGSGADEP